MSSIVCRFVSALACFVVSACFANHELDGPRDDAGTAIDMSATTHDASFPVDAGRDAGSWCNSESTLTNTSFISARYDGAPNPETPFAVETTVLRGCFCGENLRCVVDVDEAARTVTLTHELCSSPVLCDACHPELTTTCHVPGLSAGNWTVTDGTDRAFPLMVGVNTITGPTAATLEQERAAPDPAFVCDWPGTTRRIDNSEPLTLSDCSAVPNNYTSDVASITISVFDHSCFAKDGPCEIVKLDANTLQVQPRTRECSCDVCGACPPTLFLVNYVCETPSLAPGSYQLVDANGAAIGTLTMPSPETDGVVQCSEAGA